MTRSQDAALRIEAIRVARGEHAQYGNHVTLWGFLPWYCPGCRSLDIEEEKARAIFDECRVEDLWFTKKQEKESRP